MAMRGKRPTKDEIKKSLMGILQSTAFLSWSTFTFSMFLCSFRRLTGNFNVLSVAFLPSFFSSLSAIVIERPSRRAMLCLYVSNIATETLFKMGLWRGYYSSVPNGNVYIFAASIAALLCLYRNSDANTDSIFRIIKFVASPYEAKNHRHNQIRDRGDRRDMQRDRVQNPISKSNIFIESLRAYQRLISWIKSFGRHSACPHPHSCAHFVLGGGSKLFTIGLSVQIGLKLVVQLKTLFSKPHLLKSIIFQKKNFNLAVFLGGFTGIYRLVSCSLRRLNDGDNSIHALPAGLIAGLTFVMFPNNTIALYVMWKALQLLWNKGIENGKLPEVKGFIIGLYCFSTAVLFHAAMVEPQNLRSSYFKFLHNLSGGRLAAMNRIPLDQFGLETSKYLEEILIKTNTTNKLTYSF
ncbi:transmembrane protein 135-like isoform X2 [Fopius arisanus]|nr:PREDICTED: transmembrane protein 135-like isoform X2 [Fopius arisanus]XP_011302971.1 PREDICTED: transmembrane protein 135-like isoform X2 [Fopius arisanus]XP_011302972.1 PREDICTED: transmembrane protein 135-like isoform X2 [Fopius arisanus]